MKKSEALRLIGEEMRHAYIKMNTNNSFNMEIHAKNMLKLIEEKIKMIPGGYVPLLRENYGDISEESYIQDWEPEDQDGS